MSLITLKPSAAPINPPTMQAFVSVSPPSLITSFITSKKSYAYYLSLINAKVQDNLSHPICLSFKIFLFKIN